MKKILHIVSSLNGDNSASIKLSNAIIAKLLTDYPGSQVYTHDLAKTPFPHMEEAYIESFTIAAEKLTVKNKEALKHSDEAIAELLTADIVIIGVPLYNFGIPSTLKAWVDHVVRAGVTFNYSDGTPKGMVTDKKVYLAIASGAVYSDGPMKGYDFAEPYLRSVLGFIGITDITTFRIEGTKMPGVLEQAWPKALGTVDEYAF